MSTQSSDESAPTFEQLVSAPVVKNISWDFSGEVVLVTGAARSQGRSHALSFAKAGADVVLADMCENVSSVPWPLATKEELEQTVSDCRALGVRALPVIVDVRESMQVKDMVAEAISEFGKIDVLVNNAGIYPFINVLDDDIEAAWDETIAIDLKGVFLCSRHVGARMVEARKGKIVTTGSTSSFVSAANHTPYTSAKHGVAGLTKGLAIDLGPYGINVNAVCPGGVYTPHIMAWLKEAQERAVAPGKDITELGGPWSLFDNGESLHPEDISNAIMFLASDAARYITGETLIVDQGFTIK
jgi:NAD(P)-dependent dehydrogenase (short-subunit alcohol dehydrogenase family)